MRAEISSEALPLKFIFMFRDPAILSLFVLQNVWYSKIKTFLVKQKKIMDTKSADNPINKPNFSEH